MMGDNQDRLNDGHFWGCVKRYEFFGKSLFRYRSPNHMGIVR
jgi:hypothetical protein